MYLMQQISQIMKCKICKYSTKCVSRFINFNVFKSGCIVLRVCYYVNCESSTFNQMQLDENFIDEENLKGNSMQLKARLKNTFAISLKQAQTEKFNFVGLFAVNRLNLYASSISEILYSSQYIHIFTTSFRSPYISNMRLVYNSTQHLRILLHYIPSFKVISTILLHSHIRFIPPYNQYTCRNFEVLLWTTCFCSVSPHLHTEQKSQTSERLSFFTFPFPQPFLQV